MHVDAKMPLHFELSHFVPIDTVNIAPPLRGRGLLPYMGHIGMCDPKGYDSLAGLVRNRVSILAILISNRVWVLFSSLEMGIFFFFKTKLRYFSFIDKIINKSPSQCLKHRSKLGN